MSVCYLLAANAVAVAVAETLLCVLCACVRAFKVRQFDAFEVGNAA